MKKCKRKKAFIGAIVGSVVGAGLQIAASAIQANKERKAMEEQQQYQNRTDAINQAAALTTAANNQEHVDAFKNKITLRGGGKYKKVNNKDRITREKQFKCGGRKKAEIGTEIGDAAGGVMQGVAAIAGAAMQPKKRIIKSEGDMNFTNTDVREQKDYQTDVNGNVIQPQPQDNINNTIQTNPVAKPQNVFAVDRPLSARLGIKKYKKRK